MDYARGKNRIEYDFVARLRMRWFLGLEVNEAQMTQQQLYLKAIELDGDYAPAYMSWPL